MHIEVEEVSMIYQSPDGELEALRDVSFSVPVGAFVSIVGPSGCGKSTLLSLIAGLEKPTAGKIRVAGASVQGPTEIIGFMPQRDQLFEWRNIWKNVLLGPEVRHDNNERKESMVDGLLTQYALSSFKYKAPSQLSGGMRQRCALIRTLATEPEILLLDEPFSALDYQTRLAVSSDIANIIRQQRKTAVLVTHDIAEAIAMSDQIFVMSHRPGTIKAIHHLDDFKEISSMERRGREDFQKLFNIIWEELDVNV